MAGKLLLAIAVLGTLPSLRGEMLLSQGQSLGREEETPCTLNEQCKPYCFQVGEPCCDVALGGECKCCQGWEDCVAGVCTFLEPCPDLTSVNQCNSDCVEVGGGKTGCCAQNVDCAAPNNNCLKNMLQGRQLPETAGDDEVRIGNNSASRAPVVSETCVCCDLGYKCNPNGGCKCDPDLCSKVGSCSACDTSGNCAEVGKCQPGYKCEAGKGCQCDPTTCPDVHRCGGCYGGECVESGRCGTGQLCSKDCKEECVCDDGACEAVFAAHKNPCGSNYKSTCCDKDHKYCICWPEKSCTSSRTFWNPFPPVGTPLGTA